MMLDLLHQLLFPLTSLSSAKSRNKAYITVSVVVGLIVGCTPDISETDLNRVLHVDDLVLFLLLLFVILVSFGCMTFALYQLRTKVMLRSYQSKLAVIKWTRWCMLCWCWSWCWGMYFVRVRSHTQKCAHICTRT